MSPDSVAAFSLRGIEQRRGGTHILHGVDLDLPASEVIALVGPSGAGKTSLIRLLNRLDDPTSGTVSYQGNPISSIPVRELRRRVGFVFQAPTMFPGTVADNLDIARALSQVTPRVDGAPNRAITAADALRHAGVDAAQATRDAHSLSGGERQRVSIARALMSNPDVLLLDEPTSALDPDVAEHVMATIRSLADTLHLTVVMVTHRLAEARNASTLTVFMEAGRVIESGPTQTMFASPNEARTREYLLREPRE